MHSTEWTIQIQQIQTIFQRSHGTISSFLTLYCWSLTWVSKKSKYKSQARDGTFVSRLVNRLHLCPLLYRFLYQPHHHSLWTPTSSALSNMTNIYHAWVGVLIFSLGGELCMQCKVFLVLKTYTWLCVYIRERKVEEMCFAHAEEGGDICDGS